MNRNKIIIPAFIVLALIQIYFPLSMILGREEILDTGTEYKFKVAPVDPNDPFRGKFVTLNYSDNYFEVDSASGWEQGEMVYLLFKVDSQGYAMIEAVLKAPPHTTSDFLETKVNYVYTDSLTKLYLDFPFDRFYMEETKAPKAEEIYFQSARDSVQEAYSLVSIKDGKAVLKDVMIDGLSLKELADKD